MRYPYIRLILAYPTTIAVLAGLIPTVLFAIICLPIFLFFCFGIVVRSETLLSLELWNFVKLCSLLLLAVFLPFVQMGAVSGVVCSLFTVLFRLKRSTISVIMLGLVGGLAWWLIDLVFFNLFDGSVFYPKTLSWHDTTKARSSFGILLTVMLCMIALVASISVLFLPSDIALEEP
ncbi:hypothetical protein [Wielerella bovis]|uniref:hypothetical protein n=1 Tax=Wielerella bovis TaxID=2917790 RepID=UPI002019C6AB|nr:hypothetical protein [Wielerella bovis]ULJ65041.1 hypothetical protein MIS33_01690 [Wielerella bovis]ULJ67314.1 hypothetical protein MIS31_01695 [Wielerella bovis]